MKKTIEHNGSVIHVDGYRIDVNMSVDADGCAICAFRKACGMEDGSDNTVSLMTESARAYSVGEQVIVRIEERMGIKAAVYAYMIPFFIMIGVLLIMFEIGYSNAVSGSAALAALALYYIVLRIAKGRLERDLIFKLIKTEQSGEN